MSRHRRLRSIAAVVVTLASIASACTGGSDEDPVAVVVTTTTEPPAPRVDDGILQIGALIPAGDTAVGVALRDSVEAAVLEVNNGGGVLGQRVRLLVRDEGPSAVTAAEAVEELVAEDVDAILGPTSSNVAIGALDEIVDAGVVACSATAAAIALDDYPDDGLFFRSVPSESLQAVAIARKAQETGATAIAVIHVDDAFGRPYAEATLAALDLEGVFDVTTIPIPVGDDDLSNDLDLLSVNGAQTAIVLGSGADTARVLESLAQRGGAGVTSIIVNDAVRDAASRPVVAGLPDEIRTLILGVAPQIVVDGDPDDDEPPVPFAPQVTDCVNLIALAAVQANSDAPQLIAGQMSSVSSGGSLCRDFADCADKIGRGLQINFDGATTITEIGRDGDPSRARFDQFRFRDDGSDEVERPFPIGR
ncbi:MAG: ABC transporter substrate-binding protein [Ilumatobacter sp.]